MHCAWVWCQIYLVVVLALRRRGHKDLIGRLALFSRGVCEVVTIKGGDEVAHLIEQFEDGQSLGGRPVGRDGQGHGERQTRILPLLAADRTGIAPFAGLWPGHGLAARRCLFFFAVRSAASLAR